jgi:RsmE family RNA methyltransferase
VFHTVTDSTATEHNRPGHQNDHPALTKAGIDGRHQVATFVGPEGGWTEKEMNLFKQNNFQILSLGQNILRAETAAIVAVWEGLKM